VVRQHRPAGQHGDTSALARCRLEHTLEHSSVHVGARSQGLHLTTPGGLRAAIPPFRSQCWRLLGWMRGLCCTSEGQGRLGRPSTDQEAGEPGRLRHGCEVHQAGPSRRIPPALRARRTGVPGGSLRRPPAAGEQDPENRRPPVPALAVSWLQGSCPPCETER
jgi:hypothetical protein